MTTVTVLNYSDDKLSTLINIAAQTLYLVSNEPIELPNLNSFWVIEEDESNVYIALTESDLIVIIETSNESISACIERFGLNNLPKKVKLLGIPILPLVKNVDRSYEI